MNPNSRIDEITNFEPKNYEILRMVNGVYSSSKKACRKASNVSVAAAITSKARIRLYKGFLEVKKNGGRLLYCDTDSIVAAFALKSYKRVLNTYLGDVFFDSTKNDTVIPKAVFALPKTYAIKLVNGDEIVKVKGFNNNKTNFNSFKRLFDLGQDYTADSQVFSRKNQSIWLTRDEKRTNLSALTKRT